MTTEQAKNITEQALSELSAALERGHSDTLEAYLRVMARFHRYSWGNALLIFRQRPEATHIAGYHAWLKLGRHVRQGEKGLAILAPMVGRKTTHSDLAEDEQTRVFGFRVAHVFDISQTEGAPLPAFATVTGDPQGGIHRLKSLLAGKGIRLEYSSHIHPAQGLSSGGLVTLLPGLTPAAEFAVLVREVAHELLHRDERRSQTTHTIRETEAEAVAFVVCQAVGLDSNTSSVDYIQLHSGTANTLAASLEYIHQVASDLLRVVAEEFVTPGRLP